MSGYKVPEPFGKLEKYLTKEGRGGRFDALVHPQDLAVYDALPGWVQQAHFPNIVACCRLIPDKNQRFNTCSVISEREVLV